MDEKYKVSRFDLSVHDVPRMPPSAATLVVTGAGFVSYQKVLFPKGSALSDVRTVQKLNYLENLIDTEYLDEKDESSLREGLYAGLLAGLKDPYSTYYTAEQYKELNTSNEGSYVGIGAVLQKDEDGGAKVVQLYEGGPGEQAGLKTGDVIKAVDGTDVTEKETSDIASMVRDSEKDSVTLTIQRENEEKTRDIKVEIRDVEIQTVSHEMLDDDTGYIRISEFSEVTSDQYKKAFADLKSQGMKKLVVDLRDNPGGLLTAVCGVLRQILPEGLIVYTEDKNGKREEETCDGKNELTMPLAVLVNGNSASASEIFAGAIKDSNISFALLEIPSSKTGLRYLTTSTR